MDNTYGGNGTQPPFDAPASVSKAFFERYMRERALDREWGMFELLPPQMVPSHSQFLGGSGEPVGAFMFLNHDEDRRVRKDLSQTRYDSSVKEERFRFAKGAGMAPYAPQPTSYDVFASSDDVYIAEGVGKTLALEGLGKAVLGIAGVQNWHIKGQKTLMPQLAKRIKRGDKVTIAIDGDWRTNRQVHIATYRLMDAIRALDATPLLLDIPDVPGLEKTGVDDLIAQWRNAGKDPLKAFDALPRLEKIDNPFVVDIGKPLDTADNLIAARYGHDEHATFAHWQQDFYVWSGPQWEPLRLELVRKEIYDFTRDNGTNPTKHKVSLIEDALRAAAQIEVKDAPSWLDWRGNADIDELVPLANGILNIKSGRLLAQSPMMFNLNASGVDFGADATCPRWEQFLAQIYPDDRSSVDCLQEYIGYCLTTDTSQQKAMALIGAKRSGKGTIARVVTQLVGQAAVCNPTLQSLGENFGLQSFIGKKVAIVSDARASTKNNTQAMVERFLTITGEDGQHVDRKHKEPWEGRLPVRLWLMSNILPGTQDTGAALVSRFLVLNHRVSFLGKEDTRLDETLIDELPGILNWALRGLARLRERGYFVQPDSGIELTRDWRRSNSPVSAFLEDACELGVGLVVEKKLLRAAFISWCGQNNVTRQIDESHFTQELRAATGNAVTDGQRVIDGRKGVRVFIGVKLTEGEKKY